MRYIESIKKIIQQYDFISYPFGVVTGGWFLFYYFPLPFVPDCFHIKEYSKIYELFSLIISSLVSLIGIYVSVTLVAYEFFKQKSGIDFHKSLLVNRLSAFYISFSVLTILFAFVSSILISHTAPTDREISVIYYNAILFISVIACLFPIAFNLFSSLRPEKLANDELQKINSETIFIKLADNGDIDKITEYFENDSLNKIENILIALIAVKDTIKARAIVQKVALKISQLIIEEPNSKNKEYIIDRLVEFYIKVIDFALSQPNNSAMLRAFWMAVERMYSVLLERKETAKHFEKFHKQFFQRFFNRLIQTNNDELIYDGIKAVRHIIQNQVLFNMADDTKIYSLNMLRSSLEKDFVYPTDYSDEDFRNAGHWQEIAIELMNCFAYLINKGILLNKPELINQCFEQMNELTFKFHLKDIGIYKQCHFYISCATTISDYTKSAFEKNVFMEGHDAKHLIPSLLENLIKAKHPAARTILNRYCFLLIDLQKLNKLDRWFLGGLKIGNIIITEGELGGVAKQCAFSFQNGKEIQSCLDDCIDTFQILKEYYEKHPPENLGLYLVLKWQFTNILEGLVTESKDAESVIERLKNLISSFKENAD